MANEIRTLFVARLPWTVCRVALREHFSKFGVVERSQVLFDKDTGRSKRFGFVLFKDEVSITNTMECNHHEIHDTEIVELLCMFELLIITAVGGEYLKIFVQPHNPTRRAERQPEKDPFDIIIAGEN